MILWAKAMALGTPNSQRVEAIQLEDNYTVRVRLCGRPEEERVLKYSDFAASNLTPGHTTN